MTARSTILHLFGFPGVGKLTVATEVVARGNRAHARFVLVDNHLTSNVIFAVLPVDGVRVVPPEVWDRVRELRSVLLRTIEDLSPPEWSFVFTNVLTEGPRADAEVVAQLRSLAEARGSRYVPVQLTCERDELLRRVPAADRSARMKWIDPGAVGDFVDGHVLLTIDDPNLLHLDTTSMDPAIAAQRILDHLATAG